jgi:hypothetical protein
VLRWSFLMGGLVIIVDLLALLVQQRTTPDATGAEPILAVDQILNAVLFWIAGAAVFRETGRVWFGALAGLLAAVLDTVVVTTAQLMTAGPGAPIDQTAVLVQVAENLALGLGLAVAGAWFARINQRRLQR